MGGGRTEHALILFCVFVAFNSLFALPIVWAALTHRLFLLWLVVSLVCFVVLSIAEIYALWFAVGMSGEDELFWVINAIQYVAVIVPLLLLRFCGVRLVRDGVPV